MTSMPWLCSLGKVIDMYTYPCRECTDRFVNVVEGKVVRCHSTCQKYLEASAKRSETVQAILKVKKVEDGIDDYKIRAIEKTKQRTAKGR